ncbi:MAG TPA: hypothetical protein VFZ23_04915 [Pyrinomonadaceae bacterium]
MPENQKEKNDGSVAEDQKERGYYYDDAHGYEEYIPEDDEDGVTEPTDDADRSSLPQ